MNFIVGKMNGAISFDRLKGRENFVNWKLQAKSYLVVKGLWKYAETEPNASIADEVSKDMQALAHITLLLEPCTFSHISGATSAKQAWNNLISAFENKSVARKVDLLRQLVQMKLSECASMEDYVNKMIMTSVNVASAGLQLDDEVVASLMLAGLPDDFMPMVLAIENSNSKLSVDTVKTVLLQEVKFDDNKSNGVFFSKSRDKKKQFRCHSCGEVGHFAKSCPKKKHKKEKSDKSLLASHISTSFMLNNGKSSEFYVDSGCTRHMIKDREFVLNKKNALHKEVIVADSSKAAVECAGEVKLNFSTGVKATLRDVECVPSLCANLVSVSQMTAKGNRVVFEKNYCNIFDDENSLIANATLIDGLYRLNCAVVKPSESERANFAKNNQNLWHRRMGHICDDNLLRTRNATVGLNFSGKSDGKCVICIEGKQTRRPFPDNGTRAENILELVHSDVCGPFRVNSLGGARFFVTFIDDFSRKVFLIPLKSKSQVFDEFVKFKTFVENQTSHKIKVLRTDNGTEYVNKNFGDFLKKHGIKHQKTVPHTPEQNGVSERMNRTILDRTRCMLFESGLSANFWAEAANTAAYLINLVPCRGKQQTPEEIWSGIKPDLSHLRVFGSKAMLHVPKVNRTKLQPKSKECIMVGYSNESKAYRLYDKSKRGTIVGRDVTFIEDKVIESEIISNDSSPLSVALLEDNDDIEPGEESEGFDGSENTSTGEVERNLMEFVRQGRETTPVQPESDEEVVTPNPMDVPNERVVATLDLVSDDSFEEAQESVGDSDTATQPDLGTVDASVPNDLANYVGMVEATGSTDPNTVKEAMERNDRKKWHQAMHDEYLSLMENGTWSLSELPPGKSAIKCKWVFKTKRDTSGKVIRHKARLVVKGFSQKPGIDYQETFAPVVRYGSIRYLIALAAKFDLDIQQMDAVTAFLNGQLKEEIYMEQPESFNDGSNRVCKLHKSLYGLKQASRVWNKSLNQVLLNFGLKRSAADQCIYYRIEGSNVLIVAIYVDDVFIFSNQLEWQNDLKRELSSNFRMKDMGEATSILNTIRITRDRKKGTISIDQSRYLIELLDRFGMTDCNPVSTPVDVNQKISAKLSPSTDDERAQMKNVPYMNAVGALLYASQISRPDITYAVNLLSRYTQNPGKAHWGAVKRVMRYLKGTLNKKIVYYRNGTELHGYCDADWGSDLDESKSRTGYVFISQSGAISWASKRQNVIALSSVEAELIALVTTIQECIWLKRLEEELFPITSGVLTVYCDNQGAKSIVENNSYSPRTKHIRIRLDFTQREIENETLELKYVNTNENVSDFLTKAVTAIKHEKFSFNVGLE